MHGPPPTNSSTDRRSRGSGVNKKRPFFNRRSAQILAFSFGFICPVLWFVGAFLSLPRRARGADTEVAVDDDGNESALFEARAERRRSGMVKLEGGGDMDMASWVAQQAWYENARWWRKLNRGMSAVGVAVIVIIVSLLHT